MKTRTFIWLAILEMLLLGGVASAQSISTPGLHDYEAPGTKIRAGIIPSHAQIILGEPLQAAFTVENLGPTNFEFWFGGDYRGTGRHDRFKITVTNDAGEALPDPITRPPLMSGGLMQKVILKPGRHFTNVINLEDYRVFGKPGLYTVSCRFGFNDSWDKLEQTNLAVENTFRLTILKRTPERVAQELDRLVAKAQVVHGSDLGGTLELIARFGREDAVPRLSRLAEKGPVELRVAALGMLSLIPADDSLSVVLAAMKDPAPAIRTAAAASLGHRPEPRAVEALLAALADEKPPVAQAVLMALGSTKSSRAFPVITNELETGEIETQRAAIQALANFDGPEAAAILRQHINPGNLALRYEYVQALVEKLHQPMEAEWLRPVLMGREQNDAWLDSLRLLYLYGGKPAIPVMLSCLDYDVAWSDRNWWILDNGVKPCPNAPPIDYEYRLDSDGSPQQWQKNLRLLQTLKPQADMIPPPSTLPPIAPVPLLITDPPINFTPSFREVEHGGVEIKSGFLCLTLGRGIADMPYSESDFYRPLYEKSGRFRSLAGDASQRAKLKITGQQSKQLEDLLHQFAVRLCGARVSDQKTGNLYNLLVWQSGYCPFSADWSDLFRDYQEAPPWLKEQAKADLIESVRVFSQNYHAGTADFVESASKIFTSAQLEQILK